MVNKLGEFKIVDEAFAKFEDMSGAILSRSHKSKVLGLGSWVGRSDWPLSWIKTVKEVKVFGVKIVSSYKEIIAINWDFRFGKFEDAVKSWSSRALDSLSQRIEVLKTFALSRLWYLGSALPIKKGMVKKIEKVCGKFIWNQSGRILRIKMEELKKPRLEGGLGMPCVSAMTDALLVRQMTRMLGSGDSKTIGHLVHWVGAKLDGMFQAPAAVGNVLIPDHFAMMIDLLNEAVVADVLEVANWRSITNKNIYSFYISLLPEVGIAALSGLDYRPVWRRLGNDVLDPVVKDTLLLLIHNKLPTAERLGRIGVIGSNVCKVCPGGKVEDLLHYFCKCTRVESAWSWVRSRVLLMLGPSAHAVSNWELLNLFIPRSSLEKEILWLIGTTVHKFWVELFERDAVRMKDESFFGYLRFKYKQLELRSENSLQKIPGF